VGTGPLTLPWAFDRGETRVLAKVEVEPDAIAPSATTAAVPRMVLNGVMAVSCFGCEYRLDADTHWSPQSFGRTCHAGNGAARMLACDFSLYVGALGVRRDKAARDANRSSS
jgi:hypothetical protein